MIILFQPPHSSDLTPYDCFLFSKLISVLKGCRFDATDDHKKQFVKGHLKKNLLGLLCEVGTPLGKVCE